MSVRCFFYYWDLTYAFCRIDEDLDDLGSDDGSISLDDDDQLDNDDDGGSSDDLFEDESGDEEQEDSEDEDGPPKSKKTKKIMSDKDFSRKLKNTDGKDSSSVPLHSFY